MEKARRLAVYSFQTAKNIDIEARALATKALRLPQSLRYLEEQPEENERLALSPETVEKISQARFEAAVIQRATNSSASSFKHGNSSRGRPFFFERRDTRQFQTSERTNTSTNINFTNNKPTSTNNQQ
ncbi:hypothetical protein RMATCC62417_10783 [Rhizopus microsporus]|nr:hypothetical protein RMATCC62417_10783 [Rhizopus microsporus]